MALLIETVSGIGFCSGVRRTINILGKAAREYGQVETLGAAVHNQHVLQRLAQIGVSIASNIDDAKGNVVAIGTHGISPQLESEIRALHTTVINTTCPFVHRAQTTARRLSDSGFFVIVYGEADHPEVKGILGWAGNRGTATLDDNFIPTIKDLPHHIGVLSQTTQMPAHFTEFAKKLIDSALVKDAELRIIDTICHEIRERQQSAFQLAKRVDLMFVVGSHTSANTNHLAQLCSMATKTYLIETAEEIQDSWLQEDQHVGITGGASTSQETIDEIVAKLESMA
ncbi:4-hydroxy-3-methylbut-2-enyl diphosphate reductase [Chloroflexota bacterium]